MSRFKTFSDTTLGPVEKWGDSWEFFIFPPIGEERWSGDFKTRREARQERREMLPSLKGSGAVAEWNFWRR